MPTVYLSPSTQEYNPYITGAGSEEYFMNLIADAMEPYLLANGIQFSRNTPDMTAASSIRQANQGSYDFYLAIHSNASGSGSEGQTRGIIAFYYPTSANGRRAAELFAQNLREIYPLPQLVTTRATTSLGEVRQPRFPSVLLEIGYHDNYEGTVDRKQHRPHRPEPCAVADGVFRPAVRLSRPRAARHGADRLGRSGQSAQHPRRHRPGHRKNSGRCRRDGARRV